jgi:metal-responsive CopG/Arc/MetJ family transcriptional regulator
MLKESPMKTKKKISVTIDEGVYEAVDQASRHFQVARSQLAQEAFILWLRRKAESLMAQGYREMAREDEETAERSLAAQKEVLR